MKTIKFLTPLFAMALAFAACGGDDDGPISQGTVSLDPKTVSLKYGETKTVVVNISQTGLAKEKDYKWSTSDAEIATIEVDSKTGNGIITAKQIGEATISYTSTDNILKADCKVSISATQNLLNGIFFEKDATSSTIKNKMLPGTILVESETNAEKLVYTVSNLPGIEKYIFELKDDKLVATIVVLDGKPETETIADVFIKERFKKLDSVSGEKIQYYDARSNWGYTNTKVGIASKDSAPAIKYGFDLGVKYTSK